MPMTVSCATPIASGSSLAAGGGAVPAVTAGDRCAIYSPRMVAQVSRIFSWQRKPSFNAWAGVLDAARVARKTARPAALATVAPLKPRLLTQQRRAPAGGYPRDHSGYFLYITSAINVINVTKP